MVDQLPLDFQAIHSRIKQISDIPSNGLYDSSLITSDEDDLLRECVFHLQGKFSNIIKQVGFLSPQDLDMFLENLKGEICSVEAENEKVSEEVDNLMTSDLEDSIRLQSNIDGLNSFLEFFQSHGLVTKGADVLFECPESEVTHVDCKFKIFELNSQIEKKKELLKSLENLDYTFKRYEGLIKIENILTGCEVVEFERNQISLSLRTYIPETEMPEQNHELAIEFLDDTLGIKNAKIFPNDVFIDEIINAAKSFAHQFSLLPMSENETLLEWFVRRVQDRIVLSTLRKSLVKAASKSRHSIVYVDRDEMIVAHMVDGVDVFIKVSQGWPVASSPLKLLSLKGSSPSSKEVTFSFLCKVEETVNSLDVQVCQDLSTFMDAIEEIIKQRMHIELLSNN